MKKQQVALIVTGKFSPDGLFVRGQTTLDIPAYICGSFAVHRDAAMLDPHSPYTDKPKRWHITHIKSGYWIGVSYTLKEAQQACKAFEAVLDWETVKIINQQPQITVEEKNHLLSVLKDLINKGVFSRYVPD